MKIVLEIHQRTSLRMVEVKPRLIREFKDTIAEYNLGTKIYNHLCEMYQKGKYSHNYANEENEKILNAKINNGDLK